MSQVEWSQDLNQSLIEKVRCGKSPTPKDRRDKFPHGYNKSSDDAKIRIQKDILDSLKESDGIPALVYPQDYIFDIAHLRTNGNLGELIDDMSNIANPEEKLEMVKSENRILRERLHNALQREMKAIKTFQKLANENRLLLLKLKDQEGVMKGKSQNEPHYEAGYKLTNGIPRSSTRNHDCGCRKHLKLTLDDEKTNMVNKSTWTSDFRENTQTKSTSTEDLPREGLAIYDDLDEPDSKPATASPRLVRDLSLKERRQLFKARSFPNILDDSSGEDLTKARGRSASLGDHSGKVQNEGLDKMSKSASSGMINNNTATTSFTSFKKVGEKKVCSFPSSLDVVSEERESKGENSAGTDRSSMSSEGNISINHSTSSDLETNSPCHTPSFESASPERVVFPANEYLHPLHLHSRSLPSKLNRGQSPSNLNAEDNSNDMTSGNKEKRSPFTTTKTTRRKKSDSMMLERPASAGSTRSLSIGNFDDHLRITSEKNRSKKKVDKGSSSEESDQEEKSLARQRNYQRRRTGYTDNNPDDFVADIRKFQKMLSTGQIPHSSHESDNEEDILQACEAARTQRYSRRRGSAVVQIPASSVQMDLHVATEEPLGIYTNRKKHHGSTLSIEDKRGSRWASILKNRKKMLTQKDRLRISEDLKEYLSTKTRPAHIDSETELLLYRDTHWTQLMKVTDKTGHSRPLSDSSGNCLPEREMKRREAVWELFHSEVVYVTAHLLVLKECFLEPLRDLQGKGFLVSIDERKIFSNLADLCEVSAKFAKDLLHLFKNEQENQFGSTASVVAAFTKFKWTVHPQYERYCLNYTNTLNYLESLKQMEDAQEFFKWCESDSRCNRLKLTDLLVAPFQHLTKYPLLLKNIRKRTSEGDRQHAPLTSTIKSVEELIQELEGNVTVVRNYRKLKELQKSLAWPSVADLDPKSYIPEFMKGVVSRQECGDILASPKRQLIYEGPLTLYENTKTDIFAFLFDDMLLLTKRSKKSNRHLRKISGGMAHGGIIQESLRAASPAMGRKASDYNYSVWKQPIPIDRFVLHDLDEYQGNSIKHGFVLVHMSRFKQAIAIHTLQASSNDLKDTWIIKLKETQDKWNEVIEQEHSEQKNKDIDKENMTEKNSRAEKTDSDSEQESGTNSERNSSDEDEEQLFNKKDTEMQSFPNNDSHNNQRDDNLFSARSRKFAMVETKINRSLSVI